jgi:hypothetical protein
MKVVSGGIKRQRDPVERAGGELLAERGGLGHREPVVPLVPEHHLLADRRPRVAAELGGPADRDPRLVDAVHLGPYPIVTQCSSTKSHQVSYHIQWLLL